MESRNLQIHELLSNLVKFVENNPYKDLEQMDEEMERMTA